jgi:hypothetical protein
MSLFQAVFLGLLQGLTELLAGGNYFSDSGSLSRRAGEAVSARSAGIARFRGTRL